MVMGIAAAGRARILRHMGRANFGKIVMAQRAKAKKAATGAASAARSGKAKGTSRTASKSMPAGAGELERLEAECQALRAELLAAREEIARLEKRQELVVNRIDWVIDSLHNLLEDEG